MLVETVILDGQNGFFHDLWDFTDADKVPAFFTEFTHQNVIGSVNTQRHFRMVVGQLVHRRQIRVNQGHGQDDDQRTDQCDTRSDCGTGDQQTFDERFAGLISILGGRSLIFGKHASQQKNAICALSFKPGFYAHKVVSICF